FRGIEARHLAAVNWGTRHDSVEHPIEPGVDAVLRLAGGDVPAVDQLQLTLADVAELLRIFQSQRVPCPHRLTGGGLSERAVSELAARRLVEDYVILRLALAHGPFPAIGRSRFQHHPRRRATAAHGLEEVPSTPRAVGVLVAELLLIAGRLLDLHALPVSF